MYSYQRSTTPYTVTGAKYKNPPVVEIDDDVYLLKTQPKNSPEEMAERILHEHTVGSEAKSWEEKYSKREISKKINKLYHRRDDFYDIPAYRIVTEKQCNDIVARLAGTPTASTMRKKRQKVDPFAYTPQLSEDGEDKRERQEKKSLTDEQLNSLLSRLCKPTFTVSSPRQKRRCHPWLQKPPSEMTRAEEQEKLKG